MNNITILMLGAFATTFAWLGSAHSQEAEPPNIVIVEIFGCTFNDSNDLGDLMAVARRWNTWADEHEVTDYSANVLVPYLYSPAFPYDALWLGVYPNASAMGEGETVWLREGDDMNAEFGEVVSCAVHAQYAGIAAHLPANQPDPNDGNVNLMGFQDCTLHAERIIPEAVTAHRSWGEYLAGRGSDVFMGMLVPIAGENPDADYDYKAVTGFDSAATYGEFIGTIIPSGLQRAGQIFGRISDCDTTRVYQSIPVRTMQGGGD